MVENSKATSAAKIRCFLKEAFRRKWITEPLAINIKAPTAVYEPGNPFEKKEVELILTGAEAISGGVSAYAKFPKTFRLLLELMNETGLRCGDAIRYNPLKCEKSDLLWIYTYIPQKTRRTKQPKPADVYLTERLKLAIDNSEWMSRNLPFAYLSVSGKDDKTSYMANEVYERMKSVGAKCGVDDCRPHRLRDTFAVRALLNGLSLDDVSKLLNHSSISVTEKHYAAWVSGRKKRLERLLFQSFIDSQGN
jgi:integrase